MRALPLQSRGADDPPASPAAGPTAGWGPKRGEIPEVPPASVRSAYLTLSRAYLWWCLGMLAWSILCVGYFALTWQPMELVIGVLLGLLLLANVTFPATFFGGATWYKRLGWITVLTCLFGVLFAYPLVVVAIGITRRVQWGRYQGVPYFSDIWHLALCAMTLALAVWTARLALRASKLTRVLYRGEYKV